MASYLKLGKIVSAHGLKGEVVLEHYLGKSSSLKNLEALYIEEKKENLLPYFIQSARKKSATEVFVQIEGIEVREKAQTLVTKVVWIPEEEFHRLASKSAPASLLGFAIIENNTVLGEVVEVIEQPQQLVCKIIIQNKEVLIPLNEDTLVDIDNSLQQVQVRLPEGLLAIYLS
jgi:16S rRNA processing protein RimM